MFVVGKELGWFAHMNVNKKKHQSSTQTALVAFSDYSTDEQRLFTTELFYLLFADSRLFDEPGGT